MRSAIENGYNFEFIVDKNYIKLKIPLSKGFFV